MAGYKETPRQKMIAMMYLVLTAMLALNVSVEILEAFLVVNESMETTNNSFSQKIEGTYSKFDQQYAINQNKVRPYWEKAQQAKKLSNELIGFIQQTKYEAIAKSDKISIEEAKKINLRNVETKDKYDETTRYFIGESQDGSGGKARVLKDKIIKYKTDVLSLIDPANRSNIKIGLDTDGPFYDANGGRQPWEMHNFYHTILAADVTILNKLINEIQNVEFDIVNHLYASISAEDFTFDAIAAKVIPTSNYVFVGDKYEAEILVAAYDTKQNPEVVIGGGRISGENGVVKYTAIATSEGLKKYNGVIKVTSPSGVTNSYPFENEYIVARPSLTVSAMKMNVFYMGVDNPVSISAPGVPDNKLFASISTGTLHRDASGKNWIVNVSQPGKAVISVTMKDGTSSKNMGSSEFRIKRVPPPTAFIANVDGGPVAKNALLAAGAIIPRMPEDFEFDLNFTINSFSFVSIRAGDVSSLPGKGNRLTDEMKNFIKNSKRGDKFWLENIMAKGPDGSTRRLGTISLEIK